MTITKWRCTNCQAHLQEGDLLKGAHPFQLGEVIFGCPQCLEIGDLTAACDEPGCWRAVSAGTSTPQGYRSTCYEHAPRRAEEGGVP